MSAKPWFKFYPENWRSDPALQTCSIAARGLWIECLALMHEGSPRGHLALAGGVAIDEPQLARLCHVPVPELRKLLAELKRGNVFSVTESGVIYSRKMVRDEEKSREAKDNGRKGGNPNLTAPVTAQKQRGLTPGISQASTVGVKPQWPLVSGLSKGSGFTYGEETLDAGDLDGDGPFTRGEAA